MPDQPLSAAAPSGRLTDAFGGRYYRISHVDRMAPFFMNVVSSSDLWLFLASNGGLSAGRFDAEQALFPYQTVDRIYDGVGINGPITALWVETAHGPVLWEPFSPRSTGRGGIERHLYKSIEGDRVWFEEINPTLGLIFRSGWSTAGEHGLIRRCELENSGTAPVSLTLLDGLRNLQPHGIPLRLQNTSSCLADAYKTAALLPDSPLAVFALAAGIVDRAIPLESLRASIVWSAGLPDATKLVSDRQHRAFLNREAITPEASARGLRCAYLLSTSLTLLPRSRQSWLFVTDIGLTQSDVAARRAALQTADPVADVLAASEQATLRLRRLVASADGLQAGAQETTTAHHFANVLFNIMRGGVFSAGYAIPGADFTGFVHLRNRAVAQRHAGLLENLPESIARSELLARLAAAGDRDLERLGLEYLPLIFSRRHGDPSRPWNRFSIRLRDNGGRLLLAHEGNWRDIFQNWEALCLSHPEYLEGIAAKFLNASTIDGYNPYRISHTGIDWEVPDHEDPWSSIGYWGDHQVIYLLKLLEWSHRFHPGRLESWQRRDLFAYAAVPYRIGGFAALRRNPHVTIEFDAAQHRTLMAEVAIDGTDARLIRDSGSVRHVNLTEKLLVVALTRLTNYVPDGGIWMNTQRPEWNDANNALVGYGVSVVTLAYLRRFLGYLHTTYVPSLGSAAFTVTASVATLVEEIAAALAEARPCLTAPRFTVSTRASLLEALGTAGERYRSAAYRADAPTRRSLKPAAIGALLGNAITFVDHSLRANRRTDGLFHTYNLLEFSDSGVDLHHLAPMLEGQVAILSSCLLSPAETVALLEALRASPLYRADQNSYLLYPDRQLPGFLERNVIPPHLIASCSLLGSLLAAGDNRLVERDASGIFRFHADLANTEALTARLTEIGRDPAWTAPVASGAAEVGAIYEAVFHHRAFTGRSGTMFGYEGLGSIYWHMVAKLLLAVQENFRTAEAAGAPETRRLAELYYDIRAGLGFNKTPAEYGAFPTDPYSHTPGHSGAQQPGMTGQVKEEILTRLGELGVCLAGGAITFNPTMLLAAEFRAQPAPFRYFDLCGRETTTDLPAASLAFTFCGVPIVYRLSDGSAQLTVHAAGQPPRVVAGLSLDAATSAEVFGRTGTITRIDVSLGYEFRPVTLPPA